MKLFSLFPVALRGLAISAGAGAVALGLLVWLHPFDNVVVPAGTAAELSSLAGAIESARRDVALAESAVAAADTGPAAPVIVDDNAQQAATIRARAELERRQAATIRATLEASGDVAALAEIRDNAVVGQLIAQRAALETELADAASRFGPNHPTLRALKAQLKGLMQQIATRAAAVADALEAEAQLDDAEVARLLANPAPAAPVASAPPELTALRAQLAAARQRLGELVDRFVQLQATAPAAPDMAQALRNPVNLLLAAIAALATLVTQIAIWLERRQARRRANDDLDAWAADQDTIAALTVPLAPLPETSLRRAS